MKMLPQRTQSQTKPTHNDAFDTISHAFYQTNRRMATHSTKPSKPDKTDAHRRIFKINVEASVFHAFSLVSMLRNET